jgi:SNF2 family DNA or RNA helicase
MAQALRPISNLVIPEHLMLSRSERKRRFFYIYSHMYRGSPLLLMTRIWATALFPSVASDPRFGKFPVRKALNVINKYLDPHRLIIKKNIGINPNFLTSIPVFAFNKMDAEAPLKYLKKFFLGDAYKDPEELLVENPSDHTQDLAILHQKIATENIELTHSFLIPANEVLSRLKVDPRISSSLRECFLGVEVQTKDNLVLVFLNFTITKEEAQQLTTTEWRQLRNIDLYPVLLEWVHNLYGQDGNIPIASFPISKIAFSLPKNHIEAARVNDKGLSISPTGKPFFLPREIDKNQTITYEDRYLQAGLQEDDSFTLSPINTKKALEIDLNNPTTSKLPINMPVCIDWVNNKFAYTTTAGYLKIQDLTRFHTADLCHIRVLLEEREFTHALFVDIMRLGNAAGVSDTDALHEARNLDLDEFNLSETFKRDFSEAQLLLDWFGVAKRAFLSEEEQDKVVVGDVRSNGYPLFKVIAQYIKKIEEAVLTNLDAVYAKYSVSTVCETLPWVILVAEYADNLSHIRAEDQSLRKAYIDQKVDPDWELPSTPLLSDNIGVLPHQKKVRNLLKDSPDNAILPIQAGGGKSLLLLMDVLLEIKANRNSPYLILCPDHLVANYVSEVLYFTNAKLNVITLTSITVKQNGLDRLQKIAESAPRNTVVVAGFGVLAFRPRTVCYGTTPITIYSIIDFLRQFNFGYVAIDESHKTKGNTARTKAVQTLIADIPKKRLASGTMAHDTPSDLVNQIGMMDPTLFGSREQYHEKYAEEVKGNKVIRWKPGAQLQIMSKIKSRVVVAKAMRKEWAALLPKKNEWIGGVELTTLQQNVYNAILDETIERIKEDAKTNKELQRFLRGSEYASPDETDPEDGEQELDEDEGEDLANLLKPYLARLEQFLIAPGEDPLGKQVLIENDLISPKTLKILERVEAHIFGKQIEIGGKLVQYGPFPGKVLVFTNQIISAEEIYRLASPRLKACGILYKAVDKTEHGARFSKDPKIKWLVGVEKSMNEGLNLQFASRVIRTEVPWTPGVLEQGNSRVNRPELKKKEIREEIFYDTIIADSTIDVTKMARLISKVIAIGKFENAENPNYLDVPDLAIIKMSLDSIRNLNRWFDMGGNLGLESYAHALKKYDEVVRKDYEDYKQEYIKKYGHLPKLEPVPVAPDPQDAQLMTSVPYTPGVELYSANELGLVRLDEYLSIGNEFNENDNEEDSDEDSVDPTEDEIIGNLKGMPVHTEFGDGVIRLISRNSRNVSVLLDTGYSIAIRKSQCFLITRNQVSGKDIRTLILRSIGKLPSTAKITTISPKMRAMQRALRIKNKEIKLKQIQEIEQQRLEQSLAIELSFFVANGFLGIDYLVDENNQTAVQTLQACGFRSTAPFYYAKIPNALSLKKQFDLWKEKGLTFDPQIIKQGIGTAFFDLFNLIKTGSIKNHKQVYKMTTKNRVANFYRLEHKVNPDKMVFKPYPIVENGTGYLVLPANQPGSRTAMKYRYSTIKWRASDTTLSYFGSTNDISSMIKKLLESGIQITNINDLKKEFKLIRKMPIREGNSI